ncbi:cytochrome P450 [Nocardia farcinica]|uniref:Cytochrome P450 120 n=4 Tax=Nocardia TaxID=1817 RepID=A0A449GPA5_NOCFR|nr:cytochrome P450 [Nocardia farcinica]MBC9815914.1 cytochrome P450 [Nocardia farcinica]MBF6142066.1 cytochrome P450 [Nocardia farcinica]MBF6362047.1 cytochrome P450 [Nocardia farcinica]MBF6385438.1 cytochrome P450 [Nocardia farcinica]
MVEITRSVAKGFGMSLQLPTTVSAVSDNARHLRTRLSWQAQRAGLQVVKRYPTRIRPLAEPPPGSGLKPVLGDFGPPGIGYTLHTLADPMGFSRERFERLGPVSWLGVLGRPVVSVAGPEAFEEVLLDRDKVYSAQRGWEWLIGPFFHGGVMLRDFDDHMFHRRILQQAFTRPRLHGYQDLTSPLLRRGIESWRPAAEFHIHTAIKQLLLQQATEVFAGAELGRESVALAHAFEDAVHGGTAMVRANVPGGVWARGLRGRRRLEDYFRRELPAKRAGEGNDLFSVLSRATTEEGHTFTDEEVVQHMIFVMLAAHDTSTIASSMLVYELGRHPEWQDKLRAEAIGLGKESVGYDDLDELPLLDMAFKEALRMYAPVAQQARETIADTALCGHYLPRGTLVMCGPYMMMRTAQYWRDPDEFDPERFAPERREDKSHRFAWAPFGGGAHKCIGLYFGGMTVKAVLYQMLTRFRWSVRPGYEPLLVAGTGPTPADGLPIRLERLAR